MYETPSFLLFLAGSWFNCQCSCYNFHFIVFFVPQSSFDVPNLVLSVLFLTHPKFVFCIVPFLWTYNVPSSFFFTWPVGFVPFLKYDICSYDVIYQVICVMFLSLDQTYRGSTSTFARPANPHSCTSPNVPFLLFAYVPCIIYDVLYFKC